ncbi:ATP-grasp domain-containing protein [Aquimarina sp. 2201CG5-10]|uniref:ATP-grasp domain-containing protein n=1 Tax=Aquimarina callyspongiae TaxID=3098150 RepID=UPI002AB46BFC|nr:ATP-grasp domain-containing protein [Aquimarina sp. 2201CG5-10]MDY8138678.1 ATP-grasp domain-containing protein [Aquimarina sp. 2201CG5-10]
MKLNILVTGCGGDIGQSIGKILNNSDYVNKLMGCDISDKNAGQFIYEDFFLGLPYTDKDYIKNLETVIENNNIDIILPIAEPELRFFSNSKILDKIGKAQMLCANEITLEIGFDKLKTASFLKENNLPFPDTVILKDIEKPKEFPVIIKSRTGSGSSKVNVVREINEFNFLKDKYPDYIVQEYLSSEQGEYTCGLFRSGKGEIRSIILKRELTGGYSGYGEVIHNKEISETLEKIAEKLNLVGSINVQLRLTSKGPVVFEINPRFSSTVLFRHLFGFKDVLWSIEDKKDQKLSNYIEVEEGKKFYKGFSEYIS